jgi:hypothetical protein
MKKLILTFILMSFIAHASVSQSKDEKEVAEAVETLRKAMIDASESTLKAIAAEELSYGHSSGKVEDKAAFVTAIASGASDFKTIDLSEQTIRIAGNTALVRHKFVAETADNGRPGNPNLYVLLVWQKQNGKWLLLARQAVRIQPAP